MINTNQVKTRLGQTVAGTPIYGNLQDIIIPKKPIKAEEITFNLGADANLISLNGSSLPAGNIYIDGTTYEGVNGGVISVAGTDGTHTATTVEVGGRVANISRLLDENDDEVIDKVLDSTGKVEKRRFVYGLISSSVTEGGATADDKVQVNFVAWDDTNHQFEAVTVKQQNNLKLNMNRAYNTGTIASAEKAGLLGVDYDIGGYAQDELLDLQENEPMFYELTVDTEATLQSDKKIVITIGADATASSVADSAGNPISGTDVQTETVIFETGDIGKTIYELNGGIVSYNGVLVQASMVTVKATNQIEADLSNTITGTIYIGDVIALGLQGA